jgi:hypothetical protein
MLGSMVGGVIVVTNVRTLLTSDWIDAADPVRYTVYGLLYVVWAAAVVHSYRQYRKDRVVESADAVAAEAEIQANVAADVVGEPVVVDRPVHAGRPSAPRD